MLPPVVLIHGWGGSFAETFAAAGWPEALAAAGRETVEVDLPGHGVGASTAPAAYADLAADLEALLPREPLDAVGFSLGGKVTLAIAARLVGRFRRIVIGGVGDNLFSPEPAGEALAVALERGIHAETDPAVATLVRYGRASGGDPLALAAVLRRPPNPIFAESNLAGIGHVLLVNGEEDRIALPDIRLRAALGDPFYLSLPDVGHLALPSDPRFRASALDFLGSP